MNDKKVNKKILIITIAIITLLAVLIVSIIFVVKNKKEEEPTIVNDEQSDNFTIKSTKKKPIEKDGIEAENIDFNVIGSDLEVTTTLKNNTKEDLNGYLIEIEFLNDKGETVTTIVENSPDIIKPKETKTITNYVMELDNPKQITSAKIISLEKSSMGESLEETFDKMTPDLDNIEQGPTE